MNALDHMPMTAAEIAVLVERTRAASRRKSKTRMAPQVDDAIRWMHDNGKSVRSAMIRFSVSAASLYVAWARTHPSCSIAVHRRNKR